MTKLRNIKIKQRDITDCGAACLASVAAHYKLQLPVSRIRQYAGTDKRGTKVLGSVQEYSVAGPIQVKFANRTATCSARVLQGNNEPLLGAIPMEEMDVIIHPRRQKFW
jgi:ABC-type bacteriocin/lantibiotic exporter with double-glycine peptidase domain